jgi:hypothetical protein
MREEIRANRAHWGGESQRAPCKLGVSSTLVYDRMHAFDSCAS